jgi:hypothetical protein
MTATASRAPTTRVSVKTARYATQSGQPKTWISLAIPVVGLPSAPGVNSLLAMAIPAENADSAAASAIDCHNTMAARGARVGHVARASIAGTGPERTSAMTVKASADTLSVSLSRCQNR